MGGLLSVASAAFAQAWPTKAIRIIVPFAPGGIADSVARLIQPGLEDGLGQPVVVENKTGASGSVATEYVARSAPDGYTLLLALAAPQTLNQLYLTKSGTTGSRDFAPITLINTNPMVLMVNPSLPVHNVRELIAYAKGASGQAQFPQARVEFTDVSPGNDEIHGGHRHGLCSLPRWRTGRDGRRGRGSSAERLPNYSDALIWMKSGRLRPIALTSAHRFSQSPELPTIAESVAFPDMRLTVGAVWVAPGGHAP